MNDFTVKKTGSDFEVVGPADHPVDVLQAALGDQGDPVRFEQARVECDKPVTLLRPFGRYVKFLPIARAYAKMSKDTTKVGALILGPGLEVRSAGWNGAPRGSDADVDGRKDRPEKYFWMAHAEANAIANAARAGTPVEGCTMLVTLPPCMDCAKLIVQAGIRTVIYEKGDAAFQERWADHLNRSRLLFGEVGVDTVEVT